LTRPKVEEFQVPINRREFCQGAATAVIAAALGATAFPAFAQDSFPMTEMMAPQALPDIALGSAKAPVIVVEYASMTCPHCAHFAEKTFPEFKKQYIDTGKVRYIFREFPLDDLAAVVSMVARCAGEKDPDKYFAMIDTFFHTQLDWAVRDPIPHIEAISKQAGFTDASFKACVANQKLLDGIESVRQRAIDKFKVSSTPTFFINGTKAVGALTIDELAKLIDPQLKGG
jgi:protein-disulfide isomerase